MPRARIRLLVALAPLGLAFATACSLGDGVGDLSAGAVAGASGAGGVGEISAGAAGQGGQLSAGRSGAAGFAGNPRSGASGNAGAAGTPNGGGGGAAGQAGASSGNGGSSGSAGAGVAGASGAAIGGMAGGGFGGNAGADAGAGGGSVAGAGGTPGGAAGTSGASGGAGSAGGGGVSCASEVTTKGTQCGMEVPPGYADVLCAKVLCGTCLLTKSCELIPSCGVLCNEPAQLCPDQVVDRVTTCALPESFKGYATAVCNDPICAVCVLTTSCDEVQGCAKICDLTGGN